MRELTTGDDFETIKIWLHTNLKENKSFVPCKDSIHNPKSKEEVSSKGLYFWFIHPNGYDKLNKIIQLESILENRFTKKINGIDYDLVYVGTAGVRNNKNGVNNGNLFERFNWHIKNNQTLNSLKNNSISTLRSTIIPLFSDDLFKNESQQELNQLFKKYFHLFYLDYGTEFLEVKDLIKSDETILITKLKPIFNLKENDNTQNSSHITAQIQTRRNKIEKDTKLRLGFSTTIKDTTAKFNNKFLNLKGNILADKKIEVLSEKLNWENFKDKKKNKLLIIGCSDSKTSGGAMQLVNNYFDNENYNNLMIDRIISFHDYDNLLINSPNYFIYKSFNPNIPIKRNNIPVLNNYFSECRNNNLFFPAIERYAGGTFYTQQLRELYFEKNKNNLHILIISGLYGIIEFRDLIIDYHLKINTLNFWNNQSILESVKQYINENKIDDDLVFYSLSDIYRKALKPNENWNDIWIKHDRGDTSARFLKDYFLPEL